MNLDTPHIPIEDVNEIHAVPRGIPHSVQEPTEDDNDLVFISYTRKDVDFAVQVRERLEAAGHRTWMDIHDIPAGAIWPEEIDKALNRSAVVVGVMSPASVQSQNVKNEWSWALVYKVRLVLLYLEECRIPHRFIDLNSIDFRHDPEGKFEQLLRELSKSFNTTYTSPDTRKPPLAPSSENTDKPTEKADNAVPATATSEIPVQAPASDEIIDESEARNRSRMLEKVYNFWIKGVLDNSLHGAALIDLGMSEKRDAVNHPWNTLLRHDDYAEGIQISTGIASLFDRMSGELLILGQPGSGKTTMLLELGRRLIEYAQEDISQSIPVVFNLSSWADERKPMAEWIVDELNAKYQVPRKVGENWVNNDKLLLLLDGLDEVNIDYRNDCVVAINGYRSEHGLTKLAICSRIADYDALTERLRLQGAVLIQPLSAEQIDQYLASFGDSLTGVREAIRQDRELFELAETPLMLSIMAISYRYVGAAQLTNAASYQEKQNRLFSTYVEKMLTRQRDNELFSKEQTLCWLSWLAQTMVQRSVTVFLVEQIQPVVLERKSDKLLYRIIPLLPASLAIIVVSSTTVIYFDANLVPIVIGVVSGGLATIATIIYGEWLNEYIGKLTKISQLSVVVVFAGLLGGFTSAIIGPLILAEPSDVTSFFIRAYSWWFVGMLISILVAMFGVGLFSEPQSIATSEQVKWDFQQALTSIWKAKFVFIGSFIFGLAMIIVGEAWVGVALGFGSMLAVILVFALLGGLETEEIQERSTPNEGIHQSIRTSGFVGILAAIFGAMPLILASFTLFGATMMDTLIALICVVGIGGFGGAYLYGLQAVLRHYTLRYILYRNSAIPRNFISFLNQATKLILLRRVGGGYIFIHRMLLEYFATLYQGSKSSDSDH